MDGSELTIFGGFLLGFASTLHCAGMCGGIATSLTLAFGPTDGRQRLRVLMLAQAGRITSYVLVGAVLGFAGAGLYGAFNQTAAFRVMQWAGAVALVWIGVTMTGLLPMPAAIDRAVAGVSARLARALAPFRHSAMGPYLSGLTWGIIPCPMVYGALFTAMLTGSATGGALIMAGFGAGTLPGVTLTALGLGTLARLDGRRAARAAVGVAIALFGVFTVLPGSPINGILCLRPPAAVSR